MSRNAWIIAAVLALLAAPVLIVVLALAGLLLWGAASFGDRNPGLSQAEVEAYLGTPFPASARLLDGYQEGFQDGYYLARVEVDPGEVTAFVAKTKFMGPAETTDTPFVTRDGEPEWWDADRATRYEWYSRSMPGATEVLFLDRSSSSVTVVSWRRIEF